MKAKVSLKMFVLSAALLIASFTASARNNDGQLIYNPIEENGIDRKSTRLNSSHTQKSRMPSSA